MAYVDGYANGYGVSMSMDIGRLQTLDDPERHVLDFHGGRVGVTGRVSGATVDDTIAIRDEIARLDGLVAITWTEDDTFDGYYDVSSVNSETLTLIDPGMAAYTMQIKRIGDGRVEFESVLTGTVLTNDHGVTEAESRPSHSPPVGHFAYDVGGTPPSSFTRTSEDGAVTVYYDIDYTNPFWSCAPADFYGGAAKVYVSSQIRNALDAPNDTADWEISNGLVKVTPNATGGRIDVSHYDGTVWDTAKTWRIQSGGVDVGTWDAVTIMRNDPEVVIIRLTNSPSGSSAGKQTLDLTLRRGSRHVSGYLTRHVSATLGIVAATTEAGTAITPTGASSAVGVRATANDASGNRYIIGSAKSHTQDLVNGGVSKATTTTLDFFLGSEVGGTGAGGGDTAAELCLEYLGNVVEKVTRGIR